MWCIRTGEQRAPAPWSSICCAPTGRPGASPSLPALSGSLSSCSSPRGAGPGGHPPRPSAPTPCDAACTAAEPHAAEGEGRGQVSKLGGELRMLVPCQTAGQPSCYHTPAHDQHTKPIPSSLQTTRTASSTGLCSPSWMVSPSCSAARWRSARGLSRPVRACSFISGG